MAKKKAKKKVSKKTMHKKKKPEHKMTAHEQILAGRANELKAIAATRKAMYKEHMK